MDQYGLIWINMDQYGHIDLHIIWINMVYMVPIYDIYIYMIYLFHIIDNTTIDIAIMDMLRSISWTIYSMYGT